MEPLILKKSHARQIILHAAALHRPAPFGKGSEAVYKLIEHLGYIQVDTNYTIERAHHHAIFSRVPDYKPEWLAELQADGRIFEFFTADSGYQPMNEFRYSLPVKKAFAAKHKPLTQADLNTMQKVLDRIGREGPLMVKDFENDRLEASSGWWDWRPTKMALERLYFAGNLMVTRTPDFQRIYDLPANLIPGDIDTTEPTPAEFARHTILRVLRSLGIAQLKEMNWRARFVKDHTIRDEIGKLVTEGEICEVAIEGLKGPFYMLPAYRKKKIGLSGAAFILSPFDNLNVFRHRLRDYFDFDYQIECFVPEPKRKYGYFSLPVLIGDRFIGRMDSKADRKEKKLLIHNLHFESVKLSKAELVKFTDALRSFATFNGCTEIVFKKSNKKDYLKAIKAAL